MDTLRTLRLVALLEGCSFVLLLAVAMPLKYAFDLPQAVRVVGMGHGVLFILFCLVTLRVSAAQGWAGGRTARTLLASLLPWGPFLLARELDRELRPAASA
ncbi:MAG: DUF3817 domain-containing protein [Myxococcales bacterium]|nr:DUF3817 domain-containing protein [Myxococcales bacterium]